MKTKGITKSAKISMVIFMIHGLLEKIEYINYDYIAWFMMLVNIVILIGALFFNFASNANLVFFIFVASLFLLPLFALIEKAIQYTLKKLSK